MNAQTATTLTDTELTAAYEGACAAEAKWYAEGNVELMYAARSIVDIAVAEIHRRWDAGHGPHLAI